MDQGRLNTYMLPLAAQTRQPLIPPDTCSTVVNCSPLNAGAEARDLKVSSTARRS